MSRFSQPELNLKHLVDNSFRAIDRGLYETKYSSASTPQSLKQAILTSDHAPLITEVKFSSPSAGKIRESTTSPVEIADIMVQSGAAALSVLTQPYIFEGSIEYLAKVRRKVTVPLLMKDIVVSRVQIDAARNSGADCVLLIKSVFDRDLAEEGLESLEEYSLKKGLQVLVEAHSGVEYQELIKSGAELVGINNRDLDTLKVDIGTTEILLSRYGKGKSIVISESGIASARDIRYLRNAGADAFLVGTSIMQANNVAEKVKELFNAL